MGRTKKKDLTAKSILFEKKHIEWIEEQRKENPKFNLNEWVRQKINEVIEDGLRKADTNASNSDN